MEIKGALKYPTLASQGRPWEEESVRGRMSTFCLIDNGDWAFQPVKSRGNKECGEAQVKVDYMWWKRWKVRLQSWAGLDGKGL